LARINYRKREDRPSATAQLAIQAERDAGAVVTLVTIGLVLANVFLWAMLASS
jgi:hypothetical protein